MFAKSLTRIAFVSSLLVVSSIGANQPVHAQSVLDGDTKAADVAPMRNAPSSFADLAERLSPTVVNISSTQKAQELPNLPEFPEFPEGSPFQDFFNEFMGQRGQGLPVVPPASLGSGFVIDGNKGYIITNSHVIQNADEIRVTFFDDTTVDAEVVGIDEKTDLALLKVETRKKLQAAKFGESHNMRVGDWVLAIGNPFGLGGTVTAGIISARQRNINAGPYDDFIQTDASINRGNSGGPMFNLDGEVIGVNTAIFSPTGGSVGIGFAIPSDLAKPVIEQLIKYGKTRRGWLGVKIQTVTEDIAESLELDEPRGALVANVGKGGPAEKAGLKTGDIILKFDGHDISEMRTLPRVVAETNINSTVDLVYWRDGEEKTVSVTVGELEKAEEDGILQNNLPQPPQEGVKNELTGLTFGQGDDENDTRIVITDVERGSEAADQGLMVGDILLEINQTSPASPENADALIRKASTDGKDSVLFLIDPQGEGDSRFVALNIKQE